MKEYYIICKRHMKIGDGAILFWGKNYSGYYYNLNSAGKYTEDIVKKRFPEDHWSDDMPVLCSEVEKLSEKRVIDNYELGDVVMNNYANRRKLKILKKEILPYSSNYCESVFVTPERFLALNENTIKIMKQIKRGSK